MNGKKSTERDRKKEKMRIDPKLAPTPISADNLDTRSESYMRSEYILEAHSGLSRGRYEEGRQ